MLGVSVDDIYNAFPVIIGIFGSGISTIWRMPIQVQGPSFATKRAVFFAINGTIILVAIVLYLVHSQTRYGTIFNVHTGLFVVFSVLMGFLYTWIHRGTNMILKRNA